MTVSSKRPEQVAWASLILSFVFFAVAFFLGRWSGFFAVTAVSWQILAAALIWLVLAVQFHALDGVAVAVVPLGGPGENDLCHA